MRRPGSTWSRRAVVVLLVLATLLLASGCGRLSKKDFIRKGDAICRATNAEAAKTPVPAKTDIRSTADYLRETSRLLMAQDDRLDALKPPKQDQARLRDVFRRQRDGLAQLQTAADQYQLGDQDTAQVTANNANAALVEVRQDLQGYGFQDCSTQ
jgi:hypothetical protein